MPGPPIPRDRPCPWCEHAIHLLPCDRCLCHPGIPPGYLSDAEHA